MSDDERRFIWCKSATGANNWWIYDTERDGLNPNEDFFDPSSTAASSTNADVDFLSNGFKLRGTDGFTNGSGVVYLYMAFAEHPFGGSGVSQARAR
jgi:hypothetical protein